MSSASNGVTITAVRGRETLDSRGNPTVEAEVVLSTGLAIHAAVPSGASTGSHEAVELRDRDPSRFNGNGVLKAVANVNDIIGPWLVGRSPMDQAAIDAGLNELDGTDNKGNLGANAVLAVSLAVAKAAAGVSSPNGSLWHYLAAGNPVTLPVPMFNILNGGKHASNSADIQEFMVMPVGVNSFSDALRAGAEIYQSLKSLLGADGHNTNVGDEGGFAPSLPSNRDALEMVLKAVEKAGYTPGKDIHIALDVAASELFSDGLYVLEREGVSLTPVEMVKLYQEWAAEYPIISIEDGLSEDDWAGWTSLHGVLGDSTQILGDDLLVTNITRIKRSIDEKSSNAVLLKPNQIGSLSETLAALQMARGAGWGAVMSHRSGETEDTTIADLAVGWDVRQIKTGAPARSERVAKYNRLLRIESELGDQARYAGESAFDYLGRS
ncbi:MAG TPA: phosphopyruvate hydratase [Dehalococcoidia bacterium]|jgi:enolase|nr:MAG: phosphopyruvate hydratase [SAR202 cluster bacterium MP-SAtl-SRR3965592-G1]HIM61622.1 phosphopyruvate hydratase [Dehalococcoidia bacterium]HIN24179.1 phosphopyruvate hydratase [Dehalococcoidia bacterium]